MWSKWLCRGELWQSSWRYVFILCSKDAMQVLDYLKVTYTYIKKITETIQNWLNVLWNFLTTTRSRESLITTPPEPRREWVTRAELRFNTCFLINLSKSTGGYRKLQYSENLLVQENDCYSFELRKNLMWRSLEKFPRKCLLWSQSLVNLLLANFISSYIFYTPWKHQKSLVQHVEKLIVKA